MKLCNEVMTKNPTCCLPDDTIGKVAKMMRSGNIGSIPVIEDLETKKLVGIVTDRDLTLKVLADERDPITTQVAAVMTPKVVTCRAEDDLQVALDAMSMHQLRRIPVVDENGQVLGIIAQADMATRTDEPVMVGELVKDISVTKLQSSIKPIIKWLEPKSLSPRKIAIIVALLLVAAAIIAYTVISMGA